MEPQADNLQGNRKDKRRSHTRSRTGCVTCRQRHIRCDEQRPFCINCQTAARSCDYGTSKPLLRDRRAQGKPLPPWEQAPWAVQVVRASSKPSSAWQSVTGIALDPFDTLPMKMPFKSRELFHYFYQAGTSFITPNTQIDDCFSLVARDPYALRSTLLIAGLHYAWNAGNLRNYESTFFFHKVESMREVNKWLQNSHSRTAMLCIRQIATLCFAECCSGNLVTAETHLDGLVALMDIREQEPEMDGTDIEVELADRTLILASNFVHGFKSRLCEFKESLFGDPTDPNGAAAPADVAKMMRTWQKQEAGGLANRLKAIRMFPYFFSPLPPGKKTHDIDAYSVIKSLRDVTEMIDLRYQDSPIDGIPAPKSLVWNTGGPTRLLLGFVHSHVLSLSGGDGGASAPGGKPQQRLMSSWSGIASIAGIYLHSVLGLWNAGAPIEPRLHRRLLLALKREISRVEREVRAKDTNTRDFWFWKAFTGALSLALVDIPADDIASKELQIWFDECIRSWSEAVDVTKWVDARAGLARIVWPAVSDSDRTAEELWERVTGGR